MRLHATRSLLTGYIDHFQIVPAGGDEADGDPIQGEDAIWSHRWYTQTTRIGTGGPNGYGGSQIGDTGVWVGDYTIQPENGGVSVFAHEYTHDLGPPDLYDTNGGENSVNYWSLMAQGRESGPHDNSIGSRASDLGAWDKLQLGWLDHETVLPSQNRKIPLGPHKYNSDKARAAVVVLPKTQVTSNLVTPKKVPSRGGAARVRLQRVDDAEHRPPDGRQARLRGELQHRAGPRLRLRRGQRRHRLVERARHRDRPRGEQGITGDTAGAWKPMTFDLSAFGGKTVDLRFRYAGDGGVQGNDPTLTPCLFIDDIAVTGGFADGAETSPNGWTLAGFSSVGSTVSQSFDNYYVASHRDYVSFDKYLQSGPYNFGFANTKPDFVKHFPYQDGLLVSYWDTSESDNNTSAHPGEGLIRPVDANPRPIVRLDGTLWRTTSAGRRPSRCSTTTRRTGMPPSPAPASRCRTRAPTSRS